MFILKFSFTSFIQLYDTSRHTHYYNALMLLASQTYSLVPYDTSYNFRNSDTGKPTTFVYVKQTQTVTCGIVYNL